MKGTRQRNSGFTLIEVLIAVIVLSIALLGISALILNALKSNDSSTMRTQAIILAYSALDSMRGNIPAATAQPTSYATAIGTAAPAAVNCVNVSAGSQCSSAQIAQSDLNNWKTRLKAALPQGDGAIATQNSNGYTTVTITVQWDDSRAVSVFGGCTTTPCNMTVVIQSVL